MKMNKFSNAFSNGGGMKKSSNSIHGFGKNENIYFKTRNLVIYT